MMQPPPQQLHVGVDRNVKYVLNDMSKYFPPALSRPFTFTTFSAAALGGSTETDNPIAGYSLDFSQVPCM